MSYCLNPHCQRPENPTNNNFCQTCGKKLLLNDRYRSLKQLGQGGFGKTFLAQDELRPSKPYCVIKQFFPQAQGTSTLNKAVELFTREAERLDELGQHPQIPALLAHFSQEGQQYLIQEYIQGENLLQELVNHGKMTGETILKLLQNLLPVLQFVHEKQVIHRDIKPENIIHKVSSQSNLYFLVDFGASKLVNTQGGNQAGTVIGSMGYIPHEQAIGQASFSSDIYSLGVTCLQLLTGKEPADLYDSYQAKWVWLNDVVEVLDTTLITVLDKMVEPILAQRYQSISDILKDLQRVNSVPASKTNVQASSPIVSPPVTPAGNSSHNLLQKELEAVKTHFTIPPSPPPTTASNTTSKSPSLQNTPITDPQLLKDLEDLRKEFG